MEKRNFWGAIAKIVIIYLMITAFLVVFWQLLVVLNNGMKNQGFTEFNHKLDSIIGYISYPTNWLNDLNNKLALFRYNAISELLIVLHATQTNLFMILSQISSIILYLVLYIFINKNKSGKLIVITIVYIFGLFMFTQLNFVYTLIFLLAAARKGMN